MYFIQPTRSVPHLDQAIDELPSLQVIHIDDLELYDPTIIAIADVQDFLHYQWSLPTVVIAHEDEGAALAQAWQLGALAGWIWGKLPQNPVEALFQIDAQYKRNQDSRDLPAAADLQRKLLPNALDLLDYKIETFFQPSAYLSGDWYDYWKLNDKEVLFYLADVSGHGVTSSLLTSWMAAFHGRSKTPRELIKKLNGMLLQENIEKHITMVAGILNLQTHQIRWTSAGHYPPPIIFEPNQPPKILNTSSFPLGLTDDLEIEEFECTLNRHTRFIICSDGALEPFDGGLNEQFAQLVDHLQKQSFKAPEHVADDIAILSLCRLN
ncbi:RsbU family protein phosphatase GigA [Acinetobacter sp. S40]|uniref:RsbU family protein phosphatase GigA n=1 Tax=unclassified Acinetobacter TaxID=196816 RepID=UPI00190A8F65|nr:MULTISPECIES: RsbU family protein phosphatase GigA [unclassified Acinetobacter]MBJ9985469.1 RsbU family protein phosphatase GigA [Acinetobacter sp. S40]MBK0064583.1 RsbU family protein phosphatase GigA [Acinetobacter sp. S55]MBK0067870.1 RsbU family protein phosphatase GigA [Acinetobacter sp. S54]